MKTVSYNLASRDFTSGFGQEKVAVTKMYAVLTAAFKES